MTKLIAERLKQDQRILQAKKLMVDALADYKRQITGIKPPDEDLKLHYEQLLSQFAEYRGNKLWFPFLGSGIGNGALVELADGSIKYDFITGIGPHFLGHSSLELAETGFDAAMSDTVMQGHLQQNVESVELSQMLINASGMDHCFLATSGAMANENAIKIAFQHKFPAHRILAFDRAFVGRTVMLSQITDKPGFREGLPSTIQVDYVPYYDPDSPEESIAKAVATLKKHLSRYPKQHALMVMELVQGEGGFHPGTTLFFKSIMEILKSENIIVFVDEVQTFGRTFQLFAYQDFKLEEYVDIVSLGKLSQVCATLFKTSIKPRPGLLSQTFTGSTSSILAGKLIIKKLLTENFFGPNGKNAEIHQQFSSRLQQLHEKHPKLIRGPWGIGCMIAFTPFDGDTHKVNAFAHDLFEAGVMCFTAGSHPTRIRLLVPAGVITQDDIEKALMIIEQTLTK